MAEPVDLSYFPESDARLKRVYQAWDAAGAELVRQLLDAEGIAAVVQGAELQASISPLLGGSTLPGVYVREEDVPAAGEVISRFERGELEKRSDWTCPNCGEVLEGQFSACWKCGTERQAPNPET